jgi:pimeloyl-ACP methyl ester carboxylesterase
MTGEYPSRYVPFDRVRSELPNPERRQISDRVELETLHVPGPDPTLVFVHGGLGSLWNAYPQLAAFTGEQATVTYSLAGNRHSSNRPEHSIRGHVADLRNLLTELDVDQPIVHGHSYGTAIALEYAKRYSVAGVVLTAGGDHNLTPSWEKPLLRTILPLRLYRLPTNDALFRQLAYRVGFHDETPEAVIEDFIHSNPVPHRRSAWTSLIEAFWGYEGRDDIERLNAPTLVIHGPADGIVPLTVARATAARIPDAVFCRLERTGHLAPVERPEAYNRLLRLLVTVIHEGADLEELVRERTGEAATDDSI